MDVEAIFDKIGRWHLPFFSMTLVRCAPLTFHLLFLTFAASSKQDYWCARPTELRSNFSVDQWKSAALPIVKGKPSRCLVRKIVENANGAITFSANETTKCSEYEFDTTYFDWTISREFGLQCEKSWYVSSSQSVFMAGLMVGNVAFAKVADQYGRVKALQVASVATFVAGFLTIFSNSFWTFNITRFVTSIACGAFQGTMVTLIMETLSNRNRAWTMLGAFGWMVCNILLTSIAYFFRNWVHQEIAYSILTIPCLLQAFLLPESPRWLLASGRFEDAQKTFHNVVRVNKVKNMNVDKMIEDHRIEKQQHDARQTKNIDNSKRTYMDLFRGRNIRLRTFMILIMYFSNRLLMFNLTFFSARLGGNPFVSFSLVSFLGMPADALAAVCIRFLRRRRSMFVSFMATSVFILIMEAFGEDQIIYRIIICVIAKAANGIGASMLGVFASESFPTVVRAMGISSGYTASRFGAMFSPFFMELSDSMGSFFAATVAAAVGVMGAIAALFLPETLNQPLPSSLAEIDPDYYEPIQNNDSTTESQEKVKV